MPNFKTTIANFLFSKIKNNIRIDNLPINTHIENEAQARSSVWREKHDEFASSVQKLNNIIQDRDQEIRLLKSQLSYTPTRKEVFDNYLKQESRSQGNN